MSKKKKITVLIFPLIFIIAIFAIKFWGQEGTCDEYLGVFTENFDTLEYKDSTYTSAANWPSGPVILSKLGGNLQVAEPTGIGAMIYVCDDGDFDGDGKPDLIGLDITNRDTDPVNYPRLILIRNNWEDLNGDEIDDDGIIFQIDPAEVYDIGLAVGPATITVGDYNNDGLRDFFFMKNVVDDAVYDGFVAAMYINTGTAEDPDFLPYTNFPNLDFAAKFMNAGIYVQWAADHVHSVDIDQDGDTDILVISKDQIFIVRNPGPDNFTIDNFQVSELSYDQTTGYTAGMGGSSIDAADFDYDGDIDILGGSVEDYSYLVFYENDGTGNFTRKEIPIPDATCNGTVITLVEDFDQDGLVDIFGANDRWRADNPAKMWVMKNKGPVEGGPGLPFELEWKCLNDCLPILPPNNDVDIGASLDMDLDGDMDIVLADANHNGDYYQIINLLAPVYTTFGEARSLNITSELNPSTDAITKIKITSLSQGHMGGVPDGLKIEYYVTNNGRDWEFYASFEGADIIQLNNLPEHTFNHFGSQLKWKALLSAPEDPMVDYTGASFETPYINDISFEYTTVERQEYSRTSVATTITIEGEQRKKLIIGDTFYFPGFQGHLRAYDVTSMTLTDSSYSVLRTVTRPDLGAPSGRQIIPEGVDILWDAGELLNSRSAADRTIYTATPVDSDLTRLEFTVANVGTLGPLLQDFNNDNEGLINFVRGEGRDWKLADSNHSNPIVVGPPDGDPNLKGAGYDTFVTTWEDRPKVLYVGANDGMIHCFDAVTGEELWGFIPYNLLPRLRDQWAIDEATGVRYYIREELVDGSPVAEDVYIDADGDATKEWITILICGQGPGKGSVVGGGLNYYVALDVTDPNNPQPLWEFTDDRLGETWSVPEIGKITISGADTWVAFTSSGYDNNPDFEAGNVFYVVDLETGDDFWSFEVPDIDTSASFTNIPNAFPGSPSIIDIDQDGYTDRVYVGDLDGRVWRVDVSFDYQDPTSWTQELLYTDSNNYPIISNTAVWLSPSMTTPVPRLYFGTGGDDSAPSDANYSFVALLDGDVPEVEWYLGDSAILGLDAAKEVGNLNVGDKVWADPKVSDHIVYFSTFAGSIESVDPCENIAGAGKLYARYIQPVAGTVIGGTAFKTAGGPQESLGLTIKTRAAVTMGERERTEGGTRKREVYIQEYDSTIQKLEQTVGALLKIKTWREIYKIIK